MYYNYRHPDQEFPTQPEPPRYKPTEVEMWWMKGYASALLIGENTPKGKITQRAYFPATRSWKYIIADQEGWHTKEELNAA